MKNNRLMTLVGALLAMCANVSSAQSIQVLNQSQYARPGDYVTFPVLYRASLPANQSVAGVTLQINPGGPAPLPVVPGMSSEGLQVNSDCLLSNSFTVNGSASWAASPSGFPNRFVLPRPLTWLARPVPDRLPAGAEYPIAVPWVPLSCHRPTCAWSGSKPPTGCDPCPTGLYTKIG